LFQYEPLTLNLLPGNYPGSFWDTCRTQTYNTKINTYLELSVAIRNVWCLEKISILPLIISATGIVPQSLFKNLKILDLGNTLVVEIQKGIPIIILMSYREEVP
jgi:hypothetical protein